MRLYSSKVTPIATEVVRLLTTSGDIEVSSPRAAIEDIEAVLEAYLKAERELTEKAKDALERTRRPLTELGRMRSHFAQQAGVGIGDEMLDYVLDQIVQMMGHSPSFDELFSEDVELRRKMAKVFKAQLGDTDNVDAEIRAQLRHVQEGTQEWDIEYARVAQEVRRRHGMT